MNGIKFFREKAGMTQRELAKALGIWPSAISMWETGDRLPRSDKLPELAKILGCSIDDLYGDESA